MVMTSIYLQMLCPFKGKLASNDPNFSNSSHFLSLPLPPSFIDFPSTSACRFHGNDQCVCGEVSVTEQYSQLHWDEFAGEVLDSLYNTAPISMHCNQSTARLFPVSPQSPHKHKHDATMDCQSISAVCWVSSAGLHLRSCHMILILIG